mmetsp:Transcript_7625/g.16788  ORF Transcript_7625/g.16788 Transcript_7625/m.16788 type:complete len:109 (-) Transcript_7625:1503-1829(-)
MSSVLLHSIMPGARAEPLCHVHGKKKAAATACLSWWWLQGTMQPPQNGSLRSGLVAFLALCRAVVLDNDAGKAHDNDKRNQARDKAGCNPTERVDVCKVAGTKHTFRQ